jgi:hypothetical protein
VKNWLKSLFGLGASVTAAAYVPASAEVTKSDLLPEWRPLVERQIDTLAEMCKFYTNGTEAFVVFEHGTCVTVPRNLEEPLAREFAIKRLAEFLSSHPDGTPLEMKDGNFVVSAPQVDALSVVMQQTLQNQMEYIRANHTKGLQGQPSHEVLLTPLGANVFDDLGMKFLFARSFIFWDADELQPVLFVPAQNSK